MITLLSQTYQFLSLNPQVPKVSYLDSLVHGSLSSVVHAKPPPACLSIYLFICLRNPRIEKQLTVLKETCAGEALFLFERWLMQNLDSTHMTFVHFISNLHDKTLRHPGRKE